jgi:hypothetical protein
MAEVVLSFEEFRELINLLERIERHQQEGRDLTLDVRMVRMRLEQKVVSRENRKRSK